MKKFNLSKAVVKGWSTDLKINVDVEREKGLGVVDNGSINKDKTFGVKDVRLKKVNEVSMMSDDTIIA